MGLAQYATWSAWGYWAEDNICVSFISDFMDLLAIFQFWDVSLTLQQE